MNRIALASAFAALIAVPAASVAFAGPGPGDEPPVVAPKSSPEPSSPKPIAPGDGFRDGRGRFARGGRAARLGRHRMQRMRFLRSLELTDAQKATAKEAREASARVREDAHAQVRAIVKEARASGDRSDAARAALLEKVRAVRASARTAVEPEAKRVLESLTPEQRAKIEERAKAHGKTVDDAMLLRRIEQLLLRRGAHGSPRVR